MILSLALCSLSMTTGCTKKPWLEENVTFYSEELKIMIIDSYGYIDYNGKVIETFVWWSPGFSMGMYDKTFAYQFGYHSHEFDLLNGDIKYDGKMITLIVEQDKLFNHQYEKIYLNKRASTDDDIAYLNKRVKEWEEHREQTHSSSWYQTNQ